MLNLCKALLCPCCAIASASRRWLASCFVCPRLRAHGELASWQAERYFRVFVERERKGSTIKQFARVEQMRDYLQQVKQDRQVSYWCVFWCTKGTTATRLITSKVEDLCQQVGR